MLIIKKYLLFVFLLESIMAQTSLMGSLTNPMFYICLMLGLLCAIDNLIWSRKAIEKFGWAYALIAVYIVYEFFIGIEYVSQKTLLYLLSKVITFIIIISGILYNEKFYRNEAIRWLILTMSFFIIYGFATGGFVGSENRMLIGYTNPNTTGSIGAIIVGMLVFYMKNRKWSVLSILCLMAGMLGVLGGGSRTGFLILFVLIFLRYGLNVKTIAFVGGLIVLGLFILPAIGVETIGLQRLSDTITGIEGTNRDAEREAAEWMIAQKPWTGWGYGAINMGYATQISLLPSHNGYMEIIKQMGFPCAIIYFGILAITLIKSIRLNIKFKQHLDLFLALSIILLIGANYESLFIGIHEYVTNLFFFALAMVTARNYSLINNFVSND